MNKLIIFNWKMNLADFIQADDVSGNIDVVVCPPFTHLEKIKKIMPAGFKLGAQNCFWENLGAYTGEISPVLLKSLGVEYVIIGHSERRNYIGETDEMINKKVLVALEAGLKVILCVGEPTRAIARELKIKNAELRKTKIYVKKQLEKDLKNSKFLILNSKLRNHLVIAYEPVWALSTSKNGHPDTPEDALEMIKFIKQLLNTKYKIPDTRVLYGGSVDSKNIKNFLEYKEIDGALVGGASLKIDEVKKIICQTKI